MAQTNLDEALQKIGLDAAATFDHSAVNPTEHASRESLSFVAEDEDDDEEVDDPEDEGIDDDEDDEDEATDEPLRVSPT